MTRTVYVVVERETFIEDFAAIFDDEQKAEDLAVEMTADPDMGGNYMVVRAVLSKFTLTQEGEP